MLIVTCEHCGKQYRSKESLAGKNFDCTACGHDVVIPSLPESDMSTAAPPPLPSSLSPDYGSPEYDGPDRDEMPVTQQKKESPAFYVTAIIAHYFITIALVVMGFVIVATTPELQRNEGSLIGFILGFGAIGVLSAIVLVVIPVLTLLYRLWASIQDGHARTTPGMAIGLLFVPLFNLYWIFVALWGLSKDYNDYINRHGIRGRGLPEGLFLAYPILMFLVVVPVLGAICELINLVLLPIMVVQICNALNELPGSQAETRASEPGRLGASFLGKWVLTCSLAGVVTGIASSLVYGVFFADNPDEAYPRYFYFFRSLLLGFFAGLVTAIAQYLVLRAVDRRLIFWIPASLIASIAASIFSYLLYYESRGEDVMRFYILISGFSYGGVFGLAQWLCIRAVWRHAWLWIPVSIVAFMIASGVNMVFWRAFSGIGEMSQVMTVVRGTVAAVLFAAIFGVIRGVVLVVLPLKGSYYTEYEDY